MWAVTSIASVPPGSVLINPQVSYLDKTGKDLTFLSVSKRLALITLEMDI
jgi:hypothetical protein